MIIKVTEPQLKRIVEHMCSKTINEGYRWKPNASQRKEFAQKMQDPEERAAYEKRKEDRDEKRRATSKFDYPSAGGRYIPTKSQYDFAMSHSELFTTDEEKNAANLVIYGFSNNKKVSHDSIHIVNEKIRKQAQNMEEKTMIEINEMRSMMGLAPTKNVI